MKVTLPVDVTTGGRSRSHHKKHAIGAGDAVNISRKTAHHIDAPSGRIEYIAIRIIPAVEGRTGRGIRPSPPIMPDMIKPTWGTSALSVIE